MTGFRLWAPACAHVALELRDTVLPMRAAGEGWHEIEAEARPGAHYRFCAGDLSVPDPGARAQEGDWSIVADPDSYRWQDSAWRGRPWEEAVFYELHPGLLGGFRGVQAHLPRLAELANRMAAAR